MSASSERVADRSQARLTLNDLNETVLGYLIVHYPERDVSLLVDGDAALRIMAAHARRRTAGLGETLDPAVSWPFTPAG